METIPWVEKYRPTNFENIVLNDTNKRILGEIIKMDKIPNLLLYGPPGTGKTTTIMNLIKKHQNIHNNEHKEFVIHLNASDERGINTIRSQILSFVSSNNLFHKGQKFIILDEVDYMTKNAQQALKNLISKYNDNCCYCLICNYINKVDKCLQDEFIMLRFNQLPKDHIVDYLKNVCYNEELEVSDATIDKIITYFNYDIRSMINYIQSNQIDINSIKLIDAGVFADIVSQIQSSNIQNKDELTSIELLIKQICTEFNCDTQEFITNFCEFIIENVEDDTVYATTKYIYQNLQYNIDYIIKFLIIWIKDHY